jgi:hypothetical protein
MDTNLEITVLSHQDEKANEHNLPVSCRGAIGLDDEMKQHGYIQPNHRPGRLCLHNLFNFGEDVKALRMGAFRCELETRLDVAKGTLDYDKLIKQVVATWRWGMDDERQTCLIDDVSVKVYIGLDSK